ncbi:TPA: hypothetical protein ACMEXM_001498 [Klebsiella variicola subsp. variicola]
MAAKPKETIWTEKKIPPMEYMTLERASSLLSCEIDDFWHWHEIGAIKLAMRLTGGSFSGRVRPKRSGDKESIAEDMRVNEKSEIKNLCRALSITISEITPLRDLGDQRDLLFNGHAIGGVWFFSSDEKGQILRERGRAEAVFYVNLIGKRAEYVLFMAGSEEVEIKEGSVLVLKRDLERLYESISTGVTIAPEGIFGSTDQNLAGAGLVPGVRDSRMGEFIEALLLLVPDIGPKTLELNPNRRHEIIKKVFENERNNNPKFTFNPPSQMIIDKYLKN